MLTRHGHEPGWRDHPPAGKGFRLRRRTDRYRGSCVANVTPHAWAPNYSATVELHKDSSQPHGGRVWAKVRRRIDPTTMAPYYTVHYIRGDDGLHFGERHPFDTHGFAPEVHAATIIDHLLCSPHLWPRQRREWPPARRGSAVPAASTTHSTDDGTAPARISDQGAAAAEKTPAGAADPTASKPSGNRTDKSQREVIIDDMLRAHMQFWHDADHTAFASVPIGARIEQHRQRSRMFEVTIRKVHGAAHPIQTIHGPQPGPIGESAFNEARLALEAMAMNGPMREWGIRSIEHNGSVYIDMGDPDWSFCQITPHGWEIVAGADIPLIRTSGMRQLPMPKRSPDALGRLRGFLGLSTEADFLLVVLWMVAALWPHGPYPIAAFEGEQGSAKSTKARGIVRLVDPRKAPHRSPPKDEETLLIAASNARVLAFDNVSHIEADMADALCRIATGGGLGKRRLYSDDEEMVFFIARPVLLNGIPSLMARPDLADRAITITLPAIPDSARRTEASVLAELEDAAPGIMALLFDALSQAMFALPSIRLPQLPRMADWAKLACAAAPAFGWRAEDVLAALETNRRGVVADILDADPFASAVLSLISRNGRWSGTATALLTAIGDITDPDVRKDRAWPKSAAGAAARLKRVTPALRRSGLAISSARESGTGQRIIDIHKACVTPPS